MTQSVSRKYIDKTTKTIKENIREIVHVRYTLQNFAKISHNSKVKMREAYRRSIVEKKSGKRCDTFGYLLSLADLPLFTKSVFSQRG